MDSEGWFAVNGWKYLVKWPHSGSYQLCPGKVPLVCAPSWLAGAGRPRGSQVRVWGGGRLPGSLQCWRLWWLRCSGEIMMGEGLELQNYPQNFHTGAGLKELARG